MHSCPECGLDHEGAVAEPEPVVVEAAPGPNENDVKIAEIEAAAEVETARIAADAVEDDLRAEVEQLRGEVRGMREVMDRLVPEPQPEPEPVVIDTPPPAPEPEAVAPPAETEPKTKAAPERKRGFF